MNATGSINVREALCLPHVIPMRPRVIKSCLMGGDRLAYLSIEGPNANPSSMELAVECYQLLLENQELGALAFSPEAEIVTIGQGCSSLTFPMTDSPPIRTDGADGGTPAGLDYRRTVAR